LVVPVCAARPEFVTRYTEVSMGVQASRGRRPQKNFLRVPEALLRKSQSLPGDEIVVATVVRISSAALAAGRYQHLGLALVGEQPTFPAEIVPDRRRGRYSRRNVEGKEVVRRDLPKVTRRYPVEGPNWGDWSKGSHISYIPRLVYPRDFLPPKELALQLDLLDEEADGERVFLFKVTVDDVLDRRAPTFEDELLYNLNLLQENVGAVDVFTSGASRDEYLRTVYVNWEILPPGERDATITKILAGVGPVRSDVRAKVEARYALVALLGPEAFISGTSGFRRYFGARFSDNLVVFEHLEYGNAIYVIFFGGVGGTN